MIGRTKGHAVNSREVEPDGVYRAAHLEGWDADSQLGVLLDALEG